MAVPHVAGLAAVYLGINPSASPSDVKHQIIASATTGSINFKETGTQPVLSGTPNLVLNTMASLGLYKPVTAADGP